MSADGNWDFNKRH